MIIIMINNLLTKKRNQNKEIGKNHEFFEHHGL